MKTGFLVLILAIVMAACTGGYEKPSDVEGIDGDYSESSDNNNVGDVTPADGDQSNPDVEQQKKDCEIDMDCMSSKVCEVGICVSGSCQYSMSETCQNGDTDGDGEETTENNETDKDNTSESCSYVTDCTTGDRCHTRDCVYYQCVYTYITGCNPTETPEACERDSDCSRYGEECLSVGCSYYECVYAPIDGCDPLEISGGEGEDTADGDSSESEVEVEDSDGDTAEESAEAENSESAETESMETDSTEAICGEGNDDPCKRFYVEDGQCLSQTFEHCQACQANSDCAGVASECLDSGRLIEYLPTCGQASTCDQKLTTCEFGCNAGACNTEPATEEVTCTFTGCHEGFHLVIWWGGLENSSQPLVAACGEVVHLSYSGLCLWASPMIKVNTTNGPIWDFGNKLDYTCSIKPTKEELNNGVVQLSFPGVNCSL